MTQAPSKAVEAVVGILIPPACREEVLGDLIERCAISERTPTLHFCLDAFRAVPLVILSRIRRTADSFVLLMHAFVLYLSFYVVAWVKFHDFLYEPWALARLAIPGLVALLALVLEDAYAKPGHRSPLRMVRGALLGTVWALLVEAALVSAGSALRLPLWLVFYGAGLGLLLTSALRLLFSPPSTSPQERV